MSKILDSIKALLPRGRAFSIIDPTKDLRKFWNVVGATAQELVDAADLQYFDLFPQTTRELEVWERNFGLVSTNLTEQQRRDNLAVAWQETGGQTKAYIQSVLQAKGFDVYVHDWWDGVTVRDPRDAVYVLKNKLTYSSIGQDASYGADATQYGGGLTSQYGGMSVVTLGQEFNVAPDGEEFWPHFIYISGATFGDIVQIDPDRREEFEALVLKLRPLNCWVGMYIPAGAILPLELPFEL